MDLHGVIAKVESLGVELEHEIARDAKAAWEFLKAELEKLRPHAHPGTGVIAIDPDGKVVPPDAPTPTAAESNASFQQTETVGAPIGIPAAEPAPVDME